MFLYMTYIKKEMELHTMFFLMLDLPVQNTPYLVATTKTYKYGAA